MEDTEEEKIISMYPLPVTIEGTTEILEQMKKVFQNI